MPLGRKRPSPQRPPPLSPAQVAQIIRESLEYLGRIFPSHHFKQRAEERDFSIQDALAVLENGTVSATPVWNEEKRTWNYDVRGTDIEGEPLTVRIAVEDPRSIVLVTAF